MLSVFRKLVLNNTFFYGYTCINHFTIFMKIIWWEEKDVMMVHVVWNLCNDLDSDFDVCFDMQEIQTCVNIIMVVT